MSQSEFPQTRPSPLKAVSITCRGVIHNPGNIRERHQKNLVVSFFLCYVEQLQNCDGQEVAANQAVE